MLGITKNIIGCIIFIKINKKNLSTVNNTIKKTIHGILLCFAFMHITDEKSIN